MQRLLAYVYSEALGHRIWESIPNCIQVQLREESEIDKFFRLHLKVNILNPLRRITKVCVDDEDQFFGVVLYEKLPKLYIF